MSFCMSGNMISSSCGRSVFRPVHPSSSVSMERKQP